MKKTYIILLFFLISSVFSQTKNHTFQNFPVDSIEIKDTISGIYILKSCKNSRFQLKIMNSKDKYSYAIYDRKKIISKGTAKITKNEKTTNFMFGLIGGINEGKNILIQNYGNAMNQYEHFTQCDEKYLLFIRK